MSFGEFPATKGGSFYRWQVSTEPGLGGPFMRPELQGIGCYWESRGAWVLCSRAFLTSLASLPPGSPGCGILSRAALRLSELSGLICSGSQPS